jgi:hypothetical protein
MYPYYFSASANQAVSVWMRSSDFLPKIGVSFSGSTQLLAENSGSGWQYDSSYPGAVIHNVKLPVLLSRTVLDSTL